MEPRRSFRFLKELSEGAFGKVYLAEMVTGDNFKSVVAIKLLHGKWADHEEIVQRSRDEARVLGLLHHRNIIRVEDLSSINGQCAIIMEYLDGVDLKNIVNDVRDRGERIPRKVIFDVGAQVAAALEAAYHHRPLQGGEPLHLIHRDIKPSNVMLTRAGDVKVLDFGTAQARFDHREAKTQALAFGSAAYMAPERLLGDPDAPSGDIFSLGVTLYELLSLQGFGKIHIRPEKFEAKLERRIAEIDLADLAPERAEQVRATMRLLLAYEPSERPTSQQVVDLLEALAESIHDGSMRRFCRDVVSPLRSRLEPEQDPNDPLTGSTLFEDASGLSRLGDEGESSDSGLLQSASHTWISDTESPASASSGPHELSNEEAPSEPESMGAAESPGIAQVRVGGSTPAPALRMPERPSIAPFDQPPPGDAFDEDEDLAATRVAPMEPSASREAAGAPVPVPTDPATSGLHEQGPSVEIYEDEPAPEDEAPLATPRLGQIQPEQPQEASIPDPADDGSGIEIEPVRPEPIRPGPFRQPPPSAPDFPDANDLFTAPTVQLRARREDDLYDEYGEEQPRPAPERQAFVPQKPKPDAAPPRPVTPAVTPVVATGGAGHATHHQQPRPDKPSGGGMKLAIAVILALLVIGGVGTAAVLAAGVIGGEAQDSPDEDPVGNAPPEEDLLPAGTVQVGTPGPDSGTARLEISPAGQAVVEVIGSGSGKKWPWNGEGVLELQGLEPGLYRTKVTPKDGSPSTRGSFEVEAGTDCVYRFDLGGADWTRADCQ